MMYNGSPAISRPPTKSWSSFKVTLIKTLSFVLIAGAFSGLTSGVWTLGILPWL